MIVSSTSLTRRGFSAAFGAGAMSGAAASARPNVLWIVCEDTNPHLGCFGDSYAVTPNLDRFATRGLRYRNCWSTSPVCAPARTSLIAGMYAPSTGAEHMRSMTRLPAGFKMYPQVLREAGYYATNNAKEDYNLEKPDGVWDDSSKQGHWRKRKPGQPFFAVFNLEISHESQIRTRPHTLVHDPARARIPAYHPDTPEVRHDWAQYHDNITTMDRQAQALLDQLEKDGLAGDTIVFFYGDNGSGMPRSKRWPYNSGLHVPLIVHLPEKFRHLASKDYKPGAMSDRQINFVDLGPTLISLAGIRPPGHMQGHAFLGQHQTPDPEFNHGFRGRMDERYDLVRSVRDRRYIYIRNYMPHKIYGQHIAYMFETPTTRVWKKLYDEGKLNDAQKRFWETKPPEELYDLESDPDEVDNLAGSAAHRPALERLRQAQQEHALAIRDIGFLPEDEIHARSQGSTPYETAHDDRRYPLKRIMAMAGTASMLDASATPELVKGLADADSAVRYWAAMGILMRGPAAVSMTAPALRKALADGSPSVRIAAAEALGRYGAAADLAPALEALIELANLGKNRQWVALAALNAIDSLGAKAAPLAARIKALPRQRPDTPKRLAEYVPRLLEDIVARFDAS
jgi:arylsulfatase A-like enzyme